MYVYLSAPGLARPQLLTRPAQLPFESGHLHLQHIGLNLLPGEGPISLESRLVVNEKEWKKNGALNNRDRRTHRCVERQNFGQTVERGASLLLLFRSVL